MIFNDDDDDDASTHTKKSTGNTFEVSIHIASILLLPQWKLLLLLLLFSEWSLVIALCDWSKFECYV